ncbi:MAG: hypothetical protein JWP34_1676 [Massilia sp.]|jgi:hypothetical protein|nr:hypothetical protein [Massilia sp.]
MKKKWIVIPSLLVLTVIGAYATMPVWRPFWEEQRPRPKVVVDSACASFTAAWQTFAWKRSIT